MPDPRFRWRSIVIPVLGPSMLFGVGVGSIFPIIALMALELGASHAVSGVIVALIGLGSFFNNIPAGLLISRIGERKAMIGTALFSIAGLSLCLLARHPATLALGVTMQGMAQSVFYLARQTYIMDAVPLTLRARAFSLLGGTQRIGMFAGPFIAAAVMHFMGLRGAFWTAIVALILTAILCFTLKELPSTEPSTTGKTDGVSPLSPAELAKQKRPKMLAILRENYRALVTLGVGIMFIGAMRSSRQVAVPLWAEHIGLSPTATALVFGFISAIDIVFFYPAGKIMDEYGRLWVALPCGFLMGLSFVLMPLTPTLWPFILVAAVMGFGNGIGSGIMMTLGADASPAHGKTQFLSLWRLISDFGQSMGPFILSGLTALFTLGTGVFSIGLFGFASTAIFWKYLPRDTHLKARKAAVTKCVAASSNPGKQPN